MLFNKKIEPSCCYCQKGVRISDEEVACLRRGIVEASGSCRAFKYDPLKREPSVMAEIDSGKYAEEDFAI